MQAKELVEKFGSPSTKNLSAVRPIHSGNQLLAAMLHEYGYEYRIHTLSEENPLEWCIRVSVSAYLMSIGYRYVNPYGVSV
jgi:hypothetical protein